MIVDNFSSLKFIKYTSLDTTSCILKGKFLKLYKSNHSSSGFKYSGFPLSLPRRYNIPLTLIVTPLLYQHYGIQSLVYKSPSIKYSVSDICFIVSNENFPFIYQ